MLLLVEGVASWDCGEFYCEVTPLKLLDHHLVWQLAYPQWTLQLVSVVLLQVLALPQVQVRVQALVWELVRVQVQALVWELVQVQVQVQVWELI